MLWLVTTATVICLAGSGRTWLVSVCSGGLVLRKVLTASAYDMDFDTWICLMDLAS